jgi:hypothetical protein
MSTKKKYGVDPRAKAAAECYIALESAQSSISISIGVPDAMRAARYTTDESKDKTLQEPKRDFRGVAKIPVIVSERK